MRFHLIPGANNLFCNCIPSWCRNWQLNKQYLLGIQNCTVHGQQLCSDLLDQDICRVLDCLICPYLQWIQNCLSMEWLFNWFDDTCLKHLVYFFFWRLLWDEWVPVDMGFVSVLCLDWPVCGTVDWETCQYFQRCLGNWIIFVLC